MGVEIPSADFEYLLDIKKKTLHIVDKYQDKGKTVTNDIENILTYISKLNHVDLTAGYDITYLASDNAQVKVTIMDTDLEGKITVVKFSF